MFLNEFKRIDTRTRYRVELCRDCLVPGDPALYIFRVFGVGVDARFAIRGCRL